MAEQPSELIKLCLLVQVVISLTLIFATVPLVHFTSDKEKMGEFVNGRIVTVRAHHAFVLPAWL